MSERLLDYGVHVWKIVETVNFDHLNNDVISHEQSYSPLTLSAFAQSIGHLFNSITRALAAHSVRV